MKSGLPKRFWILVWLAIGTIVLGTLGLLGPSIANGHGLSVGQRLDALLEAAAYLTLNGFGPVESGGGSWGSAAAWSIRIARLLALAFVIIGIGAVVDALLGELGNWRFRSRATGLFGPRQLDLICGLVGPGLAFIDGACEQDKDANKRTLVIDAAPSAHAVDACRRRKVPLLVKDASDRTVLDLLDLDRIKRVFISTGSDEANLRILVRLSEQVGRKAARGDDILCVVYLADTVAYAPVLKALPLCDRLDLRVFNTEAVTVRELYRLPLDRDIRLDLEKPPAPPKGVHLVVVGDGAMADELVLQALQLNIYEFDLQLKVDVLCGNPTSSVDGWQSRRAGHPVDKPDGGSVCLKPDKVWEDARVLSSVGFHRLPSLEGKRIAWCEDHCLKYGWATTIIIALESTNTAAAVALGLAETLRAMSKEQDVELWVYVRDGNPEDVRCMFDPRVFDVRTVTSKESGHEKTGNGRTGNEDSHRMRIRLFRDYLGACSRDLAVAARTEEAAKRVNHVYCSVDNEQLLSDDGKKDENWRNCNEVDRESSRQAAAHAFVKQRILARQGAGADPDELLAGIEHRRWCAQQLLAGLEPLVTELSTVSTREGWKGENLKRAKEWFGEDEAKKRSWKKRNRHVDLMPFDWLKHLDEVEPGRGATEQRKDARLAKHTDYIVTGKVDKTESGARVKPTRSTSPG